MEMINSSYTSPSPMSTKQENLTFNHNTLNSYDFFWYVQHLIFSIVIVVSAFGLVGNGTVIWLLGFRMKRTPFTTYILNLAVADFGVLTFSIIIAIFIIVCLLMDLNFYVIYAVTISVLFSPFAYSTSQFLLATISLDRCVCVLCPLWYRCHRPEKLSAILCALIWLLATLQGIHIFTQLDWKILETDTLYLVVFMNSVVCLTVITFSTLILFVRFCFKPQQRQRGRLLLVILLTLFFFLIFAFPINVIYLIELKDILGQSLGYVLEFSLIGASLNSFINPLLYFLVGRKKRSLCRENLKLILRRVFIEEEEAPREEPGIQLRDLQMPLR